jgi:hypothetical protein
MGAGIEPESGSGEILLLESGDRRRGGPEAWNVSDGGRSAWSAGFFWNSSPCSKETENESDQYRCPL